MDIHVERHPHEKSLKSKRALKKLKSLTMNRGLSKTKSKKWSKDFHQKSCISMLSHFQILAKKGKLAIGIITLEDVIEEVLQV